MPEPQLLLKPVPPQSLETEPQFAAEADRSLPPPPPLEPQPQPETMSRAERRLARKNASAPPYPPTVVGVTPSRSSSASTEVADTCKPVTSPPCGLEFVRFCAYCEKFDCGLCVQSGPVSRKSVGKATPNYKKHSPFPCKVRTGYPTTFFFFGSPFPYPAFWQMYREELLLYEKWMVLYAALLQRQGKREFLPRV